MIKPDSGRSFRSNIRDKKIMLGFLATSNVVKSESCDATGNVTFSRNPKIERLK